MVLPASVHFRIMMLLKKSFTMESRKKLKRKEMSLLSFSLLTSQYIWRLARLILFNLVFFFDLITERIFRLAFYFGFVVVDLHFFLIFFFSHDLLISFNA